MFFKSIAVSGRGYSREQKRGHYERGLFAEMLSTISSSESLGNVRDHKNINV